MSLIQEEVVTNKELAEAATSVEAPEPVKKTRTRKAKELTPEEVAAKEAREAKKAERAARPPKEPADKSIKAGELRYAMTDIVTLLVTENPKRGASAERFANYVSGQTVEQALAAGLKRADIVWDIGRGYISVAAAA